MEEIGNVLEKYLEWGKKIDFFFFLSYINRNLVVDFRIKEFYDFNYVKDTIKENVALGIEHFARENGLFVPFFEQLFDYDENKLSLYLVGKYKDITVPRLALGCMRLPMRGNNIDMEELDKMVEYCMQKGANYFDTAYMYVNSQSEIAMGKVLKKYKREDFILI